MGCDTYRGLSIEGALGGGGGGGGGKALLFIDNLWILQQ